MIDVIPEQTRAAWAGFPQALTEKLVQLRGLVLDVARNEPAIGPLEETLKWGEPAFLTAATGSGTTVRIHRHKKSTYTYALYVHCQTDLIEHYKQLYKDILAFDGNRAVVFDVKDPLPVEIVKHCIVMALTYHQRKAR
ncbi:MAG: DUF1801 domain-containing protein [Sphingomonadales bacterium]|nr:DUF1801 domain-containing protein [Sphingomonadales bacterium]PIX66875.1 MAG: hypothetical protein COZ43_04455 [Sphingomonadales bacterium CG_4_10_14_3_um_filter_58_15]NCO48222.1 DUF1801 domain-containing protein [Sphingomonadales bacterium]NCO99749.1 DUF1801 domain-containing protein [Sphingomonadales bacterium]NCP27432.1 DUF1801 domain-containing protein [Sphingomonadales bacterium]